MGRISGKRLNRWLANEEWRHVALTSRLKSAAGIPRFGKIADGRLWVREENKRISGAVHISRYGVVLPVFNPDTLDSGDSDFFKRLFRSGEDTLFSIIGMENRVLEIEKQINRSPSETQTYRMFTGIGPSTSNNEAVSGLSIHHASPSDIDRLWNLEKAYQIEEVLRNSHPFDERSSRRYFLNTLKNQDVFYALLEGRPVAKAGTNARGWTYDQIGGVYVIPELRGYGIAEAVMNKLLSVIVSSGRRPCLFVKNTNHSALKLYKNLEFTDRDPFRISYWSR